MPMNDADCRCRCQLTMLMSMHNRELYGRCRRTLSMYMNDFVVYVDVAVVVVAGVCVV